MNVKSQSWKEIADFYRGMVEHGLDMLPMLRLVEEIAASPYAHGLYPITSMFTLCLSQHPDFEYGQNMLRVDSPMAASPSAIASRLMRAKSGGRSAGKMKALAPLST